MAAQMETKQSTSCSRFLKKKKEKKSEICIHNHNVKN